ncbi:flagellar protein FlbA [Borreliella burgdorferi]|uniref:flagellar protein FlbA n=2 Tax=Borreliella burgdorferi TaxID=139 RepID=UPI00016B308E|nr:flagellar protein FlbA [Borreliella burgdorferi]EEC21740.1 flagellar protein [Borreliella burgdorferi 156a]MCD2330706.1 flagellar protein FlbA [Borreliella burgdorferi]MCD2373797.1 flagellar protein FlbA [Borreliella burgdorferi]MCD2383113.1 flagellar protein FlbA [Borreliella burgdorferi]MCD2384757.1 flagellar protein FlbA [Borreliella burgdorferi]
MNDLNFRKQKLNRILTIRTYFRKLSERDLMNINKKISKINQFSDGIPNILKNLNGFDDLYIRGYIDCLNYKKTQNFKILEELRKQYNKCYDVYVDKYRQEKKIKILIKNLNNSIIKNREKKESLLLDEHVNYKVCQNLRNESE